MESDDESKKHVLMS